MTWWLRQILPGTPLGGAAMLAQAVAWPAAAVAIAAMLRAEVRLAVERLARLKYRDFEAQFRTELGRVEALDGQPPATGTKRLIDLPSESRRVLHELDAPVPATGPRPVPHGRGPRGTIEAAWAELFASADRAAGSVALSADPAPTLAACGVLGGPDLLAFERLRRLHAQFTEEAHWEPPGEVADRFARAARRLAARIGEGG